MEVIMEKEIENFSLLREKLRHSTFVDNYFLINKAPKNLRNAVEALKFYEATVDIPLSWTTDARSFSKIGETIKKIPYKGDFLRAKSTKFSISRYMEYVAVQFDTTTEEMRNCWKKIISLKK